MQAIRAVGRQEAETLIAERGEIAIECEFCHHEYHFDHHHLEKIFEPSIH